MERVFKMINVTIWNEGRHERESESVAKVYPKGIHGCIADFLGTDEELNITTATLDDADNGLPESVLENTDVLIWWGHMAHECVPDELVERVYNRVMRGMGFIALHSAHFSKPFKRLMGTTCSLRWYDDTKAIGWRFGICRMRRRWVYEGNSASQGGSVAFGYGFAADSYGK